MAEQIEMLLVSCNCTFTFCLIPIIYTVCYYIENINIVSRCQIIQ